MNLQSSFLKLYIGPMFSGKSNALIEEYKRFSQITNNIIVINHKLDSIRYSSEKITTHDGKEINAISLENLSDLNDNYLYQQADVVLIDEAQFFNDLYDFVYKQLFNNQINSRKYFIVSGLSSDFNMKPIGHIVSLIAIADEIVKLKAYCVYCRNGTLASFTSLKIPIEQSSKGNIIIGKSDTYAAVCRKHFLLHYNY